MSSSASSIISSEDERENSAQLALLSPPLSPPGSRPGSRCSSPQSPGRRRNGRLPPASAVGATLQNAVEDLFQRDLLDAGVVVRLANSDEAQRKLEDLLPIHFYSWNLKNVEAALVYVLLHMFVLLQQYTEMVRERGVYEDYISRLKARVSQLEDEKLPEGYSEDERDELMRLRRENAELRQEKAKFQASQDELFQINDAWSRDYNSLTKKIETLTSGTWSTNGTSTHHLTNGTASSHAPAASADQKARTPTHPPSLATANSHSCPNCNSLGDQVGHLSRQAKELSRRNKDLEKLLGEEERKSKQKDMLIKSLDNENQAVQLQIQEIGDLQAAARLKEEFRKLELKMRQLEKQYQDTTSKKIQLQQQVDKLRHAFMSILGVNSSRRHHHDCRAQQYMSEPLPPPPTPPGLIARGDHMGSLVEKDRQLRVLFDEQVTGFERATPLNMSLPSDTRSWPQVTKRSPRPNTLVPATNGHLNYHSKTGLLATPPAHQQQQQMRVVLCPTCTTSFDIGSETGFSHMFEHVSYCGPKTVCKTELSSNKVT